MLEYVKEGRKPFPDAGTQPFLGTGERIAHFGKGYSNLLRASGIDHEHQHQSVSINPM